MIAATGKGRCLARIGWFVYVCVEMKTKVVKLDSENVDSAKIKEAAEVIDAGGLVAFPTETVYGIACRVTADSLARLDGIKNRDASKAYTLHISRPDETGRYVPTIGLRACKLIEKAWPGPLTIVFELSANDIEKQQRMLGQEVFEGLYRGGSVGVRCPDNPVACALLAQTRRAVVAPSANPGGASPAVDAQEALDMLEGKIDLVLDGGLCKYGKSSTVVKIGKQRIEILRGGVYSSSEIEEYSQVKFLFVCTGNTCRSPMAEGILRKYLAEKLHCAVDQLGAMGYKVASAGLLNLEGASASSESVAACSARGVDISSHRSQPLSVELIEESDRIFAMERIHQARVVALSPGAAGKCVLLADDEIGDPIGQRKAVYDRCADLIEKAVKNRIGELAL